MGILVIGGAVLVLASAIGIIANLSIPAFQPRGPRRRASIVRLITCGVLLIVGAAIVIVFGALSNVTIVIQ